MKKAEVGSSHVPTPSRSDRFWGLDLTSMLTLAGLSICSVVFVVVAGSAGLGRVTVHRLTIGAGSRQGESYLLSEALKEVVERHYANVRIEVQETGGTSENLSLLESNEVQLATAQADVSAGPAARTLVILYPDRFQLLVPPGSTVNAFDDLQGLRIALPQEGGQFRSFLDIAAHFGLRETDFTFVGTNEQLANNAFLSGQADAVFRVRALGNPSISEVVQTGQAKLISIQQAAAMRIKYTAFEPSVIPQGTYQANPPIPDIALPTIAVQRLLLARFSVDDQAALAITEVLLERRQELADAIPDQAAHVRPLLADVTSPLGEGRISAPVHPGAQAYFERDQPSFLQENVDYIGFLMSIVLLVGSWLWELKKILERRQKNKADIYSKEAIQLMNDSRTCQDYAKVEHYRQRLLQLLTETVSDLDNDQISEESFQSFRVVWQIAMDVVREQQAMLQRNLLQQQQQRQKHQPASR